MGIAQAPARNTLPEIRLRAKFLRHLDACHLSRQEEQRCYCIHPSHLATCHEWKVLHQYHCGRSRNRCDGVPVHKTTGISIWSASTTARGCIWQVHSWKFGNWMVATKPCDRRIDVYSFHVHGRCSMHAIERSAERPNTNGRPPIRFPTCSVIPHQSRTARP